MLMTYARHHNRATKVLFDDELLHVAAPKLEPRYYENGPMSARLSHCSLVVVTVGDAMKLPCASTWIDASKLMI